MAGTRIQQHGRVYSVMLIVKYVPQEQNMTDLPVRLTLICKVLLVNHPVLPLISQIRSLILVTYVMTHDIRAQVP